MPLSLEKMGASLAVERDFNIVCFESHSLQIVTVLGANSIDRFFIGPVIEDTELEGTGNG